MSTPTLHHITAADGTVLTITTAVDAIGTVTVLVHREPKVSLARKPNGEHVIAAVEFTARAQS